VVVIDAGHGGEDPGTVSRGGIREKNVALGVARAMAAELKRSGGFDVVMIRDGDTFVPIWDRGARATTAKGERHGIFVSIHANSAAGRGSPARGYETYFLSEARTEHERRVAAIENAPLGVDAAPEGSGGDLGFILRELKNLDQQHWSSLLAEMVQQEVGRVHPGPDRGVKQAPLAVITNAIMPAVLVEIGYLSHPEEAKLIGEAGFQEEAGKALARAVTRFFQRYPPGSGPAGGGR
jgi:N-acetylmuramoyl-L-alanine amidase